MLNVNLALKVNANQVHVVNVVLIVSHAQIVNLALEASVLVMVEIDSTFLLYNELNV